MNRKAILFGINNSINYSKHLEGSHNDVRIWSSIITKSPFNYQVEEFFDIKESEGKERIKKFLLSDVKQGDTGLIFFSGHGANEQYSSASSAEYICFSEGVLYDYELHTLFDSLQKENTRLILVFDACSSYGFERPWKRMDEKQLSKEYPAIKYLPRQSKFELKNEPLSFNSIVKNRTQNKERIFMSAVNGISRDAWEYVYQIGDKLEARGAFSHYSNEVINANRNISYNDLEERVNLCLNTGSNKFQKMKVFGSDLIGNEPILL